MKIPGYREDNSIKTYVFKQYYRHEFIGCYETKASSPSQAWAIFFKNNPQFDRKCRTKEYRVSIIEE